MLAAALVSILAAQVGCESVQGRAAPTTARGYVDGQEPVYVHTISRVPDGMAMLGFVSARGSGEDATVDKLVPELIRQAQRLGATHLVLDDLHMSYPILTTMSGYPPGCGFRRPCFGPYPESFEIPTLLANGRAFGPPGRVAAPMPNGAAQ
jgi:hypothetical protein